MRDVKNLASNVDETVSRSGGVILREAVRHGQRASARRIGNDRDGIVNWFNVSR